MFDKDVIHMYKNIAAPDSLRDRILNPQSQAQTQDKRTGSVHILQKQYRRVYAVAGCFLFIFLFSLSVIRYNSVSLQISEQADLPAVISESDIAVLLELNTRKETEIITSSGYLSAIDSNTTRGRTKEKSLSISDKQKIQWIFEDESETANASITIITNNKKTIYALSFDDSKNTWVLRKKD